MSIVLDHLSHPPEFTGEMWEEARESSIPMSERSSLAKPIWLTWQNESQDTVKDLVLVPQLLEELSLTGWIHQHPTHEDTSRSQMCQV